MTQAAQPSFRRYEEDLKLLIEKGDRLHMSMQYSCYPEAFREEAARMMPDKKECAEFLKGLPVFGREYQSWYSEAQVLIKQLLPGRLGDFISHYSKPKARKELSYGNYVIEDYLHRIEVRNGFDEVTVGPSAAITQFEQQLHIVKAIGQRFKSSLFDIRQLVQADLLDSELEAARELVKSGFLRGAGAIAGVVLEAHLAQVAQNHSLSVAKKHPTISTWNDLLKDQSVIDMVQWRFIQHLGDLRNMCDHKKDRDPTKENIEDLISGVEKITKTLY